MKSCEYQQIDLRALPTPPPTHDQGTEQPRRPRRRWEVFPGRNRFYCGGRVMGARHCGVLPLTVGLILGTSGLFFIFDCPFLVTHLASCIPAVGGVLFVFVIITLLQTSFSDPGILPRATPDEAADVERQIDADGNASYRPPPRTREVLINQQLVRLKFCFTCRMFRPPRTSHCSLCDNCVERFDHHCPWVGNCVGRRNYRFFYTFIVSLSFLTAFIFGCVTTHLALRAQDGRGLVFALQESPGSAVELVICFFSVWSILGLSGFHTYLVASNRTTNEDIKGSWSGKSGAATNPYSHHNICSNCCAVLCAPMPPSLIDPRGFLPGEESAQTGGAGGEPSALGRKNPTNACTQGTKGLLESAALSPLLSPSCPQGKPPTNPRCHAAAVTSDPTPERSRTCSARHAPGSPRRHGRGRAKKHKQAAPHVTDPAPPSPPGPDPGSSRRRAPSPRAVTGSTPDLVLAQ